jgi:hypothetical protein
MRFGNQYVWLNRSFNQFYASASQANSTGLAQRVAGMNSAYTSISNLSKSMQNSTIFMYDGPLSPEQLGSICSSYYNATTAPWYCVAVGYCENLGYNYSKLAAVGSLLSSVNSQPLSDAQIMQLAANVGNNESVYVYPVISKQKLAQLDAMLNATVPGYGALVNATAELLSHISNATLKAELTTIQSNYHNVTSDYFHANLSRANATLTLQYAALSNDFTTLNSTYASVLAYAANNTAKLIELQLYGASDAKVSDMALTQLTLNSQLSSGLISNVTGIGLRLKAIASQLSDYSTSPITLTEMARSIDSPFIRAMGSLLGMSYSSATGAAPLFGSILSLIVGIALIACLFIYRSYLMRKHKLAMNQRTAQNWRRVFLIASVLVLLYIIITYSLLTGANSSAPFSAFQSAYKGSQSVIVAVNGTPTLAESDCASMIGTQAIAQDKDPIIASFSSGLCKVGNSTSTSDACLSKYAGSNIPVIVLTSSSQSGIGLYSLYGTVLNVMGNDTTMQACYVSLLTR